MSRVIQSIDGDTRPIHPWTAGMVAMSEMKSHTVTAPDGRNLDVVEYNPAGAATLLVHNGTPGSRLVLDQWISQAIERDVRILSFSRPGYGGSDRRQGRSVADGATDSATVLSQLSDGPSMTLGISGGGPHALADGARLPDRISGVVVMAGPAPFDAEGLDFYAGMSEDNVTEFSTAEKGEAALKTFLEPVREAMSSEADGMGEALAGLLSSPDVAALPEVLSCLMEGIHEGLRPGVDGWVDDDLAFVANWGFTPNDVSVPTLVLHGHQDRFVSLAHAEWIAARVPDVDLRTYEDEGHISLALHRFSIAIDWLLEHANA